MPRTAGSLPGIHGELGKGHHGIGLSAPITHPHSVPASLVRRPRMIGAKLESSEQLRRGIASCARSGRGTFAREIARILLIRLSAETMRTTLITCLAAVAAMACSTTTP